MITKYETIELLQQLLEALNELDSLWGQSIEPLEEGICEAA